MRLEQQRVPRRHGRQVAASEQRRRRLAALCSLARRRARRRAHRRWQGRLARARSRRAQGGARSEEGGAPRRRASLLGVGRRLWPRRGGGSLGGHCVVPLLEGGLCGGGGWGAGWLGGVPLLEGRVRASALARIGRLNVTVRARFVVGGPPPRSMSFAASGTFSSTNVPYTRSRRDVWLYSIAAVAPMPAALRSTSVNGRTLELIVAIKSSN